MVIAIFINHTNGSIPSVTDLFSISLVQDMHFNVLKSLRMYLERWLQAQNTKSLPKKKNYFYIVRLNESHFDISEREELAF